MQVGVGLGQALDERDHVLHLVGVEEAEALVDVERHARMLQLALVLAVTVARAEQDGDVARRHRARHAGLAIAHRLALAQQPRHFGGDRAGAAGGVGGDDQAHRPAPRVQSLHREPVQLVVAEGVVAIAALVDGPADVVDELLQRRHRAEAADDGPARLPPGSQPRRSAAPPRRGRRHRRRGSRRSTACGRRPRRSTAAPVLRGPGRRPRPRPAPAARPVATARGWCPAARRPARAGSATRAGSGSARTLPSAPAAPGP